MPSGLKWLGLLGVLGEGLLYPADQLLALNELGERRSRLREFKGLFHAAIVPQCRCIPRCIAAEVSRIILLKRRANPPNMNGHTPALYTAQYTCIAVGAQLKSGRTIRLVFRIFIHKQCIKARSGHKSPRPCGYVVEVLWKAWIRKMGFPQNSLNR